MSDIYDDELVEDAEIEGLPQRSRFGGFLRGLLLGVLVSGAVLLGLTLSHPLPGNLPGISTVEVERDDPAKPEQQVVVATQPQGGTEPAEAEPSPTLEATSSDPASATVSGATASQDDAAEVAAAGDEEISGPNSGAVTDGGTGSAASAETEEVATGASATPQQESGSEQSDTQVAAVEPSAPAPEPAALPEIPKLQLSGPAFSVNARSFDASENAPLLAVVLDDAGNGAVEPDALALMTMPLTLAIRPEGPESTTLASAAHAAKHEVLVLMPIARSEAETGPEILHAGLTDAQAEALTQRSLAMIPDALGVAPPEGALLTSDVAAMKSILKPLQEHGHAFIDATAGGGSVVSSLAKESGLTYGVTSRSVAEGATADQIFTSLENAAFQARQRGTAIVRITASREALTALLRWGLEKDRRPVWFAPVSAVLKRRAETR